jgi:hypothetical protein
VGTQPAPRFALHVGVFAARLGGTAGPMFPHDPAEVAHVFWLPRNALEHSVRVHRNTPRGEIEVPASVHERHIVWGFTRRVLREFFELPAEDPQLGTPIAPHRGTSGEEPTLR